MTLELGQKEKPLMFIEHNYEPGDFMYFKLYPRRVVKEFTQGHRVSAAAGYEPQQFGSVGAL